MPGRVRFALSAVTAAFAALAVVSLVTGIVAPAASSAVAAAAAAAAVLVRRNVRHAQHLPLGSLGAAVAVSFIFDRWWALLPLLLGGVAVVAFMAWLRYFGPVQDLPADVRAALASTLNMAAETLAGVHVGATQHGAVVMVTYADTDLEDVSRAAAFRTERSRLATAEQLIAKQGMVPAASFVVVRGDRKPVEVDGVIVCSAGHLSRAVTDRTRGAGASIDLDNVDLKEYGLSREAARQVTRQSHARKPGPKVQHKGRVTRVVK